MTDANAATDPLDDRAHPLPRWVTAVDVLAVAAIVMSTAIALGGGMRLGLGPVRLSLTSPWRPLVLAVLLVLIRHSRYRHPAAPLHLWRRWRSFQSTDAVRQVWPIFLWSRLAVLVTAWFGVVTIGYGPPRLAFKMSDNAALNLLARWDTGWYLGIASLGYEWDPGFHGQQNIAFFPAYPLLMRIVGRLFMGDAYLLAGFVVTLTAFLLGLVFLYRLALDWRLSPDEARSAVVLLAAYPFAVFYSAVYTEALFLFGAVGAFYYFLRGRWLAAAVLGLVVGLTRPNGCFLSAALAAALWFDHGGERRRQLAAWMSAAAPGVGMLMYSAYIYQLTGHPFQWARSHAAWGRTYRGVGTLVTERWDYIQYYGLYGYLRDMPYDALNAAGLLLVVAALVPVARRFGWGAATFLAVNVVPPLLLGGLLSLGRVSATLFPIFLWLAVITVPAQRAGVTTAFAMGQAFVAILFFTWRPLY